MGADDCGLDQVVVPLTSSDCAHDGTVALPHGEHARGVPDRHGGPAVLRAEVLSKHGDLAAAAGGAVVRADAGDHGLVVPA